MKKHLLWAALALPALLAMTACSNDDDDNNGGGTGGSALKAPTTEMITAPTERGWSGDHENGVLYYSLNETESRTIKSKIVKRAVSDDDDFELDGDVKLFMSFNMQEGKVRAGLAGSVICMEFEDESTARTVYNNFKNTADPFGESYDEDQDYDDFDEDDWDSQEEFLCWKYFINKYVTAVKQNVHLQGRTVWFPQNNLGGLTSTQLVACVSSWLYGDEDDMQLSKPIFATSWNAETLTYECIMQSGRFTDYNLVGLEKATMKGVRKNGQWTGYIMTASFSSESTARLYYNQFAAEKDDDKWDDNSISEVSISGKVITVTYDVKDCTAEYLKKYFIYQDVQSGVPSFFYTVFDTF